ncbi:MAG: HDOD domain-containing protein, partial [FCB group bacterium]|nr:HDOD domain-containing protein [FCB group bacterium]
DLWVEDDVSTDSFWLPPKILALIEEKSDLPAIPEIVIRITSMVNEADCTLNEISKLIKTDPSLSARIVQVANSAFYGSGLMEISDVQTSVTRLGLLQLRNIVLAFSVLKQFESVKLINKQQFWIHSFVVAQISKSLAKLLGQPEEVQEQAYMAGLMHDIGIVVMTYILPDIYERLLRIKTGRSIKNSHSTLQDEEIHVFKTNHAAIGAAYIRHWWPVDEVIVAAVGNHHGSVRSKNNSIIDNVIIAANIYCQSMGLDNSVNFAVNPSEFDREIFRLISLTDPQIEEFINNFESEVESAEMIMSSG